MDPRTVGRALYHLGTAGFGVSPGPHWTCRGGGGGGASESKRRDPHAPKPVCNAYMLFCQSRRGELKQQLPELAFGRLGAKLGEMWRNMTPNDKQPYEDRATLDRDRYRREMLEYTARREHAADAVKPEPETSDHEQKLERDGS